MELASLPPLALYVHLPWCVRKCPYCDFNSHALRAELPEDRYVDALLRDLEAEASAIEGRTVETIFFGGGTPSLFRPESIARLLAGIRARVALAPGAEITLEANPGTVDGARFRGFREAGVNRLSIGVQSFEPEKLQILGRIHSSDDARSAAEAARAVGFEDFNLDLMYGLPGQTIDDAVSDVRTAIALAPTHLSVYQLTIEPNTLFHQYPPLLPDDDDVDDMRQALLRALEQNGYAQYEVSAYASAGRQCRHNRNYWEFGDYLGIGAGAHGKVSEANRVVRSAKARHPDAYLRDIDAGVHPIPHVLSAADLAFEFMLNALRLRDGFAPALFTERTGLAGDAIEVPVKTAREKGLLDRDRTYIRPTELGRRFLNDLTAIFLPE